MHNRLVRRRIIAGIAGVMAVTTILTGCVNGKSNSEGSEMGVKRAQNLTAMALESGSGGTYTATGKLDDTLGLGVNHLAFGLASSQNKGDENYFFSPYSISCALTILDNAARGSTKTQMEQVLGITELSDWNTQMALFRNRPQSEKTYVTTADSLWIDQSYTLNRAAEEVFFPVVRDGLGAEVFLADFRKDSEHVAEEITAWVSDRTNGMIPDYQTITNSNTRMDILDAVYFYGEWQNKFMAQDTYDGIFHGAKGEQTVPMMHMYNAQYRYYEDGLIQGLAVPYVDENYVMNILIPVDHTRNVRKLFEAMTEEAKQEFLQNLLKADPVDVDVFGLPKFSFDSTFEGLKERLEELGMQDVFCESADLSILSETIYAGNIQHRARIELDEEGSRAAAVTEIDMNDGCGMPPEDPLRFVVDCPFLFFIQDRQTGMILFLGGVAGF